MVDSARFTDFDSTINLATVNSRTFKCPSKAEIELMILRQALRDIVNQKSYLIADAKARARRALEMIDGN